MAGPESRCSPWTNCRDLGGKEGRRNSGMLDVARKGGVEPHVGASLAIGVGMIVDSSMELPSARRSLTPRSASFGTAAGSIGVLGTCASTTFVLLPACHAREERRVPIGRTVVRCRLRTAPKHGEGGVPDLCDGVARVSGVIHLLLERPDLSDGLLDGERRLDRRLAHGVAAKPSWAASGPKWATAHGPQRLELDS